MNAKVETYERRLEAAHRLGRVTKYLSLCGIGFALWVDYLWGIALEKVEAGEQRCESWFLWWLCGSEEVRISAILSVLNGISFLIFLVFTAYLVYWAYMDTFVRRARGEKSWPFSKKLVFGAGMNLCIYVALRLATEILR